MSQGLWNRIVLIWKRAVSFGKVLAVLCAFWAFAISMRQKEFDRFNAIKPLFEIIEVSPNTNSFRLTNHGEPVYFNGYEKTNAGRLVTKTPRQYSALRKDQRAEFQFSDKLSNGDIMVSYWSDIDVNEYKLTIKWKEDVEKNGFYIDGIPLAFRSASFLTTPSRSDSRLKSIWSKPSYWLTMPSYWLDSITNSLVPKDWFSDEVRPKDDQLTVGAAGDPHSWRQQVIYLIMPDRFSNGDTTNDQLGIPECYDPHDPSKFHGGDLAGVRQKLDYLRELGVSTIWITPVYKQVKSIAGSGGSKHGGCGYHGYWPDFEDPPTGSLEPKLGTATDLTGLISDLHGRGMRFILDMVVNHAGYGARIVDQHRDWFHPPANRCAALGDPAIFCPLAGLPDFTQENNSVSQYLIDESTSWVHRFRVDGIRMDTARHVPGPFFRDRWIPAIHSIRNNLFLLAEAFLEQSASQLKPFVVDQGFDSAFNFPLRRALVDALAKGGSVDFIAQSMHDTIAMLGLERTLMLVNFLDNHDVPRFVNEPGPSVAEREIQKRYRLALIALFTLPGIPQLYYGNELGLYGDADPDNRRDMPDWAWESSGRSQERPGQALLIPQSTFSDVQKLIRIRNENSALYRGDYAELWRQNGDPQPNVYAFFRSDGGSRIITALNNGDVPSGSISMPIRENGSIAAQDRVALVDGTVLEDILDAGAPSPLIVSDGHVTLNLPAKIAGIYRPRSPENPSAVTFRVRAKTARGETLYISGNSAELGFWDPQRAVRLKSSDCIGSECTWSMTLRYLRQGQSLMFKFFRKAEAGSTWEAAGSACAYTVPATSAATYDGKLLND